jgi:SnoaL-like domain
MDYVTYHQLVALKHAYFRHLDLKEFDALGELLTEDATAAYDDGKRSYTSRQGIVDFLTEAMSDPGIITKHHGHHPELIEVAPGEATGTWYLEDRVLIPAYDLEISGTAFYEDRYVRVDGHWRIAHTGYRRVFEEHRTHTTHELRSLTTRFAPPAS